MKLNLLRQKLDREDQKILQILKIRMDLSRQVGNLKKGLNLPVENIDREKEILQKVQKIAKKMKLRPQIIKRLFEIILNESKRVQE